MYYSDYQIIDLLKKYVINEYKNNVNYINQNKNKLIAIIPELNKKINEYYLNIKKIQNKIDFYNNKKESYKTIKNEVLYNGILKIGNTTKDKMWYDISCAIDNNHMELYKDILQVHKSRINDLQNQFVRYNKYLNDFISIKKELQNMIVKVA